MRLISLPFKASPYQESSLTVNDGNNDVEVAWKVQDLALLSSYRKGLELSNAEPYWYEPPYIPVLRTSNRLCPACKRLVFSHEGALYDLDQLTQPDAVDSFEQKV